MEFAPTDVNTDQNGDTPNSVVLVVSEANVADANTWTPFCQRMSMLPSDASARSSAETVDGVRGDSRVLK